MLPFCTTTAQRHDEVAFRTTKGTKAFRGTGVPPVNHHPDGHGPAARAAPFFYSRPGWPCHVSITAGTAVLRRSRSATIGVHPRPKPVSVPRQRRTPGADAVCRCGIRSPQSVPGRAGREAAARGLCSRRHTRGVVWADASSSPPPEPDSGRGGFMQRRHTLGAVYSWPRETCAPARSHRGGPSIVGLAAGQRGARAMRGRYMRRLASLRNATCFPGGIYSKFRASFHEILQHSCMPLLDNGLWIMGY
jgi:hypothetical protein